MKDFSWTLARVLALNGAPVHITVGEVDPEGPVIAAFGGILNAQPIDVPNDAHEILVLSIDHVAEGMRVGTVFIYRSLFHDAERDDDGTIRIWVGSQLLCLESLAPDPALQRPGSLSE